MIRGWINLQFFKIALVGGGIMAFLAIGLCLHFLIGKGELP